MRPFHHSIRWKMKPSLMLDKCGRYFPLLLRRHYHLFYISSIRSIRWIRHQYTLHAPYDLLFKLPPLKPRLPFRRYMINSKIRLDIVSRMWNLRKKYGNKNIFKDSLRFYFLFGNLFVREATFYLLYLLLVLPSLLDVWLIMIPSSLGSVRNVSKPLRRSFFILIPFMSTHLVRN